MFRKFKLLTTCFLENFILPKILWANSFAAMMVIWIGFISCTKPTDNQEPEPDPGNNPPDSVVYTNPVPKDPAVANTIGFFLDDWAPKTYPLPAYVNQESPKSFTVTVRVDAGTVLTKVPPSVFGNNSNLWMTQIITENSLMNHLQNLQPKIIRFPGGSISDIFFWNAENNQPPAQAPATLVNADGIPSPSGFWYGKNKDGWTLSVENYYKLREQTGSQGMITVNYGYARYGTGANPVSDAAHLAADWVRYDNGRTKYWEIGNEVNGTWEAGYRIDTKNNRDGQPELITGDLYGKHFKVFSDSMHAAAAETGKVIYIGAPLLEAAPASWQTQTDKEWNQGVLAQVKSVTDFYIVHNYFTPFQTNEKPGVILNTAIEGTSSMMSYLKKNLSDAAAPMIPIALTEWNISSRGSMQQVSFINGIHAVLLLGKALENGFGMTARWDLANGWDSGNDMGLFSIGDEPGVQKWTPRPAFYYLYFFQKTMGDRMLSASVEGSTDILSFASSFSSGQQSVILVNKGTTTQTAKIVSNAAPGKRYYYYTLAGGTDNGEFSRKVFINGTGPEGIAGGPDSYATLKAVSSSTQSGILVTLPPKSVVYTVIDKKE